MFIIHKGKSTVAQNEKMYYHVFIEHFVGRKPLISKEQHPIVKSQ